MHSECLLYEITSECTSECISKAYIFSRVLVELDFVYKQTTNNHPKSLCIEWISEQELKNKFFVVEN